jgi:hypothetical protein
MYSHPVEPARMRIDDAVRKIDDALPTLARDVVRRHLDLSDSDNLNFYEHPDGREHHKTQWHQWGVLTHTRVFLREFETDVPARLRSWGLWQATDAHLSLGIDGVDRWNLLRISILLHDIGKFSARRRGHRGFHFSGHELESGMVIREELDLGQYGLTESQIEYIARTAEDHFVLGLVRRRARELGRFDLEFPGTEEFKELCYSIKHDHADDFVEIGVLYLGDSMSKFEANTGPELAVSQEPINEAVARRYLSLVLDQATL